MKFDVDEFLEMERIRKGYKVFAISTDQLDSSHLNAWISMVMVYSKQFISWIYSATSIATIVALGDLSQVQSAIVKSLPDLNARINICKKTHDITYYDEQSVKNFFLQMKPFIDEDHLDVNRDRKRKTVNKLFLQAVYEDNYSTVEHYLSYGVIDINSIQDKFGETAIVKACDNGNFKMAQLLVENGANISYQNKFGYTLLHSASSSGNKELVKYLLEKNCININAKSVPDIEEKQFTPLDIAIEHKHTEIIELLKQHGAQTSSMQTVENLTSQVLRFK